MKIIAVIILLHFASGIIPCDSQTPQLDWAFNTGPNATASNNFLMTDATGNIYSGGGYYGSTDFDPGPGVFMVSGSGNFVLKLTESGAFVWVKTFPGTSYGVIYSMAFDNDYNILFTGMFLGTIDFDPDTGTYNLTAQSTDIFLCKLDSTGTFSWAEAMGGTSNSVGTSITCDAYNNVYLTGTFMGTVDFDPDTSFYPITSAGQTDIFISKFDSNGQFIWVKTIGGSLNDFSTSIVTDDVANIYTAGHFLGTSDFDPGPDSLLMTSAGIDDLFLLKLDSSGNLIRAQRTGSSSYEHTEQMVMDASNYIFRTGYFSGTVDFDPDTLVYNLTSAGGIDIFVSKSDTAGNLIWAKRIGTSGIDDYGQSIVADNSGRIYFTGGFGGTVDFDPGPGVYNLTGAGNYDVFVCGLDTAGNFGWAFRIGATVNDRGYSIATGTNGGVFTTGEWDGTSDFDPGPGIFNLTSSGGSNSFLQKVTDLAVNVNESPGLSKFYIYPNPSHGKITFSSGGTFTLYNSVGLEVITTVLSNGSLELILPELPDGIYFYQMHLENRTVQNGKLILLKMEN